MASDILESVYAEHPLLRKHGFALVDSRAEGLAHPRNRGGGAIEFYPPGERDNPVPGRPTIELFDPELRGAALKRAIFGDMLHHMPAVSRRFAKLRRRFGGTLTDEQKRIDKGAFRAAQTGADESRSYGKWFEASRLDAYIRGQLAPDERDEWRGHYTSEQLDLLGQMNRIVSGGEPSMMTE